jgi:signal transduction histidine kinase
MLDAPLVINNQLVGIICCENIDTEHQWRAEEILLVSALCDILTISYKALQNREYIEQIRVKNIELSDQTSRINGFNEELRAINEHLEERVHERTRALEEQNEQLTEYAFINSHLLRAPLSRILGLINLIHESELSHRERELITHLHESGRQLDAIVHKISTTLDSGNPLTRDELAEKK